MMTTEAKTKSLRKGRIALFLFSLPFSLVGIGMLFFAVLPNIHDWVRMHNWVAVEATLLSADLNSSASDNSISYVVTASYRYIYNHHRYQGQRVGISEKADNIGDWHKRTYRAIKKMKPLHVWVNPNNPDESIYDRNLRWGKLGFYMIFVLVFGGVGIGLGWAALLKPVEIPDHLPLWQGDPGWKGNQIRSSAKSGMWGMWGFAAIWNLISAPILFIFPGEWAKGNVAGVIGLLFPLTGAWLISNAIKKTREWRYFGPTLLRLDPFPGAIGGDAGGVITIKRRLPHDAVAEVVLSCVHVCQRRSGGETNTERNVIWQDQQSIKLEAGANSSLIKFCFQVPGELPASQPPQGDHHEWTLEVSCKLPGTDLDRSYTIPVFANANAPQSAVRPLPAVDNATHSPIPAGLMHIDRSAGHLQLHFPLFRHWSTALMLIIAGAIFAGIGFYFMLNEIRNGPPLFFDIIFSAIGTPIVIGGLYMLGNTLTVIASAQGLQITRRLYGIPFTKQINHSEIGSLQAAQGMQTTQGTKTLRYYSVKAHTRSGAAIKVAEGLPGTSAAEYVITQLKQAANIADVPERAGTATPMPGNKKYGMDNLAGEVLEKRENIGRIAKWATNVVAIGALLYFLAKFFAY